MNKKYLLREVAGEYLLVPIGESSVQFNSLVTMNETGAFIWKKLDKGMDTEQIAEALTKEYTISLQQAKNDVIEFINYLKNKSII
ncbi:MAG: PqqD family protein [Acutalibacteraceae bacterium]|nr:PqqD family protein [Acutalibacteraceae bacterium]